MWSAAVLPPLLPCKPSLRWKAVKPRLIGYRNRPVLGRKADHGRAAAVLYTAMIIVPSFAGVRADAGVAAHRRMAVRFHQKAGVEAGRYAQRQRTVHGIRHQLRTIPVLAERYGDRPVLRVQPKFSASSGETDRPIFRGNVRFAGAILHADGSIGGARGEFSVHAVETNRTVVRTDLNVGGARRADEQKHRPVVVLAGWSADGNLAS